MLTCKMPLLQKVKLKEIYHFSLMKFSHGILGANMQQLYPVKFLSQGAVIYFNARNLLRCCESLVKGYLLLISK